MRRIIIACLMFLLSPIRAEEIVFGAEGSDPPFQMLNTQGELEGFDIDLAKALCKALERECKFSIMSFDSIIQAVRQRKVDAAIASLDVTPARKKQVAFTDPYYNYANETVTSFAATNPDMTVAKAKTVGVQNGTTFQQYLLAKHPNLNVKTYTAVQDAILDLQSGRVDVVFGDVEVLEFLFTSYPKLRFIGDKITDSDFFGTGFAIAVNQKNPQLVKDLNRALKQLHESGEYQQIVSRWLENK